MYLDCLQHRNASAGTLFIFQLAAVALLRSFMQIRISPLVQKRLKIAEPHRENQLLRINHPTHLSVRRAWALFRVEY